MIETRPLELTDAIKELVIARLDVIPPNVGVSIGGEGNFTKDELIEHVKKGDDVGQKIARIELAFLKAVKEGILLDEILKVDQPVSVHG